MYPKVFSDFAAAQEAYGPVSVLPTPVYFYGMEPEDEIFVEIERGKTLVVRCLAIGETDEKGMVTVFFELNGQPRRVKVPDRAHGAGARHGPAQGRAGQRGACRRADAGRGVDARRRSRVRRSRPATCCCRSRQ